jgi:hypothetical protein
MDTVYTGQFWKGVEKAIGQGYRRFEGKIDAEISLLLSNSNQENIARTYNRHKVDTYIAFDAKAVNKAANSSKRGNYRYCFSDGSVYLMEHTNKGSYKAV